MYASARREFFNPSFFTWYFIGACVALVGALTYVTHQILFTGTGVSYLYLLMIIQITPFLIALGQQKYNFISFTLFNHLLCYSIPKLNQMSNIFKVDDLFPEAIASIQELIICTTIMAVSYYFFRLFMFYSFVEREKYQLLSLSRLQLIVVSFYVIGVPVLIDYLPSWALIFHFAAVAADMVLLMSSHSPGNEKLSNLLRIGVFISAGIYFVKTGMLTMVGNLAGYLFIAACLRRQYKLLLIPLVLTLVGSAVQTVKMPFRQYIQNNPTARYSDRMEMLGALIYSEYLEGSGAGQAEEEMEADDLGKREVGESILHGFSRLGDDSIERVLAWTPSYVPFWGGSSYESLPYLFIPRVLWSDKPSRHIWNKFGRTYGILSEEDNQTSVAVNYFAEAYMNFGFSGMYVCALFMGLLIAAVERLSYYFLGGYFYFTFMAFLMPVMTYATDLGSIIQSVLIVGSVLYLFRKQFLKMALRDDYS